MSETVLAVDRLRVEIRAEGQRVLATRDVGFALERGHRLGIVGESGSGKSTTALAIVGLLPRNADIVSGSIRYRGEELVGLPEEKRRRIRGRHIAMVFQSAATALNPLVRVGQQIADVAQVHQRLSRRDAWRVAVDTLTAMGIADPARNARAYPHQYSGGMTQRALIGMALTAHPEVLLADEPTTGLDPIVQTQVLDKIVEQVEARAASLIVISHDIDVVRRACTDVVVMYGGQIMESGTTDTVLSAPQHPYTRALLGAAEPGENGRFSFIPGRVPTLDAAFSGCTFFDRCPLAERLGRPRACVELQPAARPSSTRSLCACHFVEAGSAA